MLMMMTAKMEGKNMVRKKFKSNYRIDFDKKVDKGSAEKIAEFELESMTFDVRKGYFNFDGYESICISIEFSNGSTTGYNTGITTNMPDWKEQLEERIKKLHSLNDELCVLSMRKENLQKKAEPFLRESTEIQNKMFRLVNVAVVD